MKAIFKVGMKYLPVLFATGTMVYIAYREIMIDKEIEVLRHQ